MIYVIAETRLVSGITTGDIKAGKCEAELCIKIGFSANFNRRKLQYFTDTPRIDVLYTYEEGTDEDEKRLHKYFEKFQPGDLNGREWFKWNEEIIKFFEINTTIDQVREALDQAKIRLSTDFEIERQKRFIKQITPLINLIIDLDTLGWMMPKPEDFWEQFNELYCCLGWKRSISDIFRFLEVSGVSENKISQLAEKYNLYCSVDRTELKEFDRLTQYEAKMKYVCELGKQISKEKFEFFLNSIPASFKNYYITLGPDVCAAFSYRGSLLREQLNKIINNQGKQYSVEDKVLDFFKVGERYTKSFIKEKLREIYEECNYQKTPKANDLETWFEIKLCKLTNKETKKKDHGFLIVSKK